MKHDFNFNDLLQFGIFLIALIALVVQISQL